MSDERCRSCRKPIQWAVTEKGRRMPIDVEPAADGNIVLQVRGRFMPPLAIVRGAVLIDDNNEKRYKSHFATCPNAAQHRKNHEDSTT
jgi:hypothetical protein